MAEDHRYSWLDDSAAERLLRGEPVEGQPEAPDGRGDQSYADAERLAAVLSAVAGAGRTAAPSDASVLPGEEAAVAAFRAARVEAAGAGAGSVAEMDMARRPQRIRRFRERQPRLRRPLRAGMVAVVAGCALSGFAVAAAAGVLPTPFGQSDHTPGPSVSMPDGGPGGSARPEISEDGGTTTPDPSGSGDNDASDVGSNGAQGGTVPSDPDHDGKGKNGRTNPSKGKHGAPKWALAVCPRYLAAELGTGEDLDKKSLKKLTKAAGGASAIHGYCTQVLADDGTGSTPRSDESTGSGGDSGGTDSGSGNGGSGNGGSNGSGNGSGSGSGDSAGSDSGGDSGGEPGKGGGDGATAPPPPPPDTTDTPSDVTTPTTAADPVKSTDAPASGDPTTTAETGAD
ncbi:hypothetical protein JBE04_34335 [Streptomyces sp. PRKS01-29]|nr:hypothetical protein [Streptomyces sabulosicollis]MBI0299404.1 hypothetical protein [Streptomyces sabulosicollis]